MIKNIIFKIVEKHQSKSNISWKRTDLFFSNISCVPLPWCTSCKSYDSINSHEKTVTEITEEKVIVNLYLPSQWLKPS